MKRQTILFSLLLIVFAIYIRMNTVQPLSGAYEDPSKQFSEIDEYLPKVQQENESVESTIAIIPNVKNDQSKLSTIQVSPISEIKTTTEVSESIHPVSYEQEEGVGILLISFDNETEVVASPITPPSMPSSDLSSVKGFHIQGNFEDAPLNLIVNSRYEDGCHKMHFLDWNVNHPNKFQLSESLGCEAYVQVFENDNVLVAQFYVDPTSTREYFEFDLNATTELALAQ